MRVKDIAFAFRRVMCMLLVACLLPLQMVGSYGVARAESFEEYRLLVGDIFTIPTHALNRISITDPEIADISDAQPDELTLMGKTPGQTILFIWEGAEKRSIIIRVMNQDLAVIQSRIQSLLESAGIQSVKMSENLSEGRLVLTGEVPEDKQEAFETFIGDFDEHIINLTKKEESKDLVQIDMQITELKTTLSKVMGVDWFSGGSGDQKTDLTWGIGEIAPFEGTPQKGQQRIQDLFRVGHFVRTSTILAQVDALVTKGKGTILSKPRLVVMSGKEATFLVGGEIPIKTVTGTTGATSTITENIEYKEYGVSLSITPTLKEGKIDIVLGAEISDIDASAPTTVASIGTAFLTRSAQTQLLLDDHQTIVLAGMIRKDRSHFDKRVPILGYIPILGWLFRSAGSLTPDSDTEVVISLTATILSTSKKSTEAAKNHVADISDVDARSEKANLTNQVEKMGQVSAVITGDDKQKNSSFSNPVILEKQQLDKTISTKKVSASPVPNEKKVSPTTTVAQPIAKNSGKPAANIQAIAPYAQMIQEKISSAIAYPFEAKQNGWHGTVKLSLILKRDGSLRDVFVKETSGYEIFDQDAVNTAQILAPYSQFPANIKEEEISITIPIVYSQDSFLKNVAKHN